MAVVLIESLGNLALTPEDETPVTAGAGAMVRPNQVAPSARCECVREKSHSFVRLMPGLFFLSS